jgi:hypothetical protein
MQRNTSNYFRFYNIADLHQAIGHQTSAEVSNQITFEDIEKGMIESLALGTTDKVLHS